MKITLKSVRALAATLLTFGSLAGGANAAVTIDVEGVPGSSVTTWTFSGSYDIFLFDGDPSDGQFSFNGAQQIGEPNYYRGGAGGDWSGEIASDANLNNADVGMTILTARATGSSSGAHFIDGLVIDSDGADGGDDFGWYIAGDLEAFETLTLSGTSEAPIDITKFGEGATLIQNTGDNFSINNSSDTDNKGIITLNFTAIPEPSSALLIGVGALSILVRRRRKR
ncbi:PEP-CTERM sorting domain-containing protein [Akkermansiaceae bacterium]|nr:PEP-CTERM sorting domain-containing protein [Akkermansiaceae bacterium]